MPEIDKALQILGIPHSALLSIIFGMMLVSFPIGAYVVFNTDAGGEITHEYPLEYADTLLGPLSQSLPVQIGLGDAFVVIWATFAVLFAVGMFGPRDNLVKTLSSILTSGRDGSSNYLISMLKWFVILVFLSAVIDLVQGWFGISIDPPEFDNDLVQFFSASLAPLTEEVGFRVLLIGLPLYAMFYRRSPSWRGLFRSLWHPSGNLDVYDHRRRVFALIVLAGILFGMAHVLLGESWSGGKFAQATLGGIILGWVYYRHGLPAAILLHWAMNYFVFSYAYFVAHLGDVSVKEAFSHSLLVTMEPLFLVSGIVSLAFVMANYCSKRGVQNRPEP